MRAFALAAVMLGLLGLAGCGKKGPPSPPGPPDQIIYPRNYPIPPSTPPPKVSPEATWPWPRP